MGRGVIVASGTRQRATRGCGLPSPASMAAVCHGARRTRRERQVDHGWRCWPGCLGAASPAQRSKSPQALFPRLRKSEIAARPCSLRAGSQQPSLAKAPRRQRWQHFGPGISGMPRIESLQQAQASVLYCLLPKFPVSCLCATSWRHCVFALNLAHAESPLPPTPYPRAGQR
jgi:hypothetical protein